MKTAKVNFPSAIEKISKETLNNIQSSLTQKIIQQTNNFASDFTQKGGEISFYRKPNPVSDTLTFPFLGLPREFLNLVANKLNIEFLKNSKILQEYNLKKEQEMYKRALRGLLKTGDEFIEKSIDELIENHKTDLIVSINMQFYNNSTAKSLT